MPAAPKSRTMRDPGLLAWVRGLTCLIGGRHECRGKVDPHHVRSRGAGGADRSNVVPLCRAGHDVAHDVGPNRFLRAFGVDLWAEARRLTAWYLERHPDAPPETPHQRAKRPPRFRKDRLRREEREAVEEIRSLGPAALPHERALLAALDRAYPRPSAMAASDGGNHKGE